MGGITGTIPPKEQINHADLKDMPDTEGVETSHDARYARKALNEAITGLWTFPTIVITDGAGHFFQLPKLTTAQRDALTPVNGMVIYNSTTNQVERYQAGAWGSFGVATFLALTDTPSNYSGDGGKLAAVKAAEDGLEFVPNFAWEHIETIQLASDAPSFSFDNLSTDYIAFRLLAYIRRSTFGSPLSVGGYFNDDTGSNYSWVDLLGNGLTASSSGDISGYFLLGAYDDVNYGICFAYIQNIEAGRTKELMSFAGLGGTGIRNIINRWNNTTSKITKITLSALIGSLYAGTWATLEGCRKQ